MCYVMYISACNNPNLKTRFVLFYDINLQNSKRKSISGSILCADYQSADEAIGVLGRSSHSVTQLTMDGNGILK